MCGIAGILRFDDASIKHADIHAIIQKLVHRGSDNAGIKFGSKYHPNQAEMTQSAEIALAHRRLAIIDLQPSASQPMFYAENNLCITYNGEIYNYLELKKFLSTKDYAFKTTSDTEVLLAAYHYWGKDCVKHLNGMFAFAIWDEKKKYLFCARDHLGIKPFYYRLTSNSFSFASESLALVRNPSDLNLDAIHSYLLSMYVLTKQSLFSGITKLAPAHYLIVHPDGRCETECYWTVNQFEIAHENSQRMENITGLIESAIARQLVSDVPVGGFLSGGIDSGLITALAAPQSRAFHTYSVGYEGLVNNELPHAKAIATRFRTTHHELMISAKDAFQHLNKALSKLSEPVADPAIVGTYMLAEMAAADGVKVLLNGTGGDEIFAGYTRYTGHLSLKRKMFLSLPKSIQQSLTNLPFATKTKLRLRHPSLDMVFSTGGSYFLAQQLLADQRVVTHYLQQLAHSFTETQPPTQSLLYQNMLFDMQAYLPDQLLFLLDQMTMAHTIEGRVPLLDIQIIQAAFQFKAHTHIKKGQTKSLLKQIALPHLGMQHTQRKKQGFAGSSVWWVKENYSAMLDVISEINLIPHFEKFDLGAVLKKPAHHNDIFILYCFCKWYERIRVC